MSKYSEFSIGNEKTRVEGELENQLLNITNYKNQSQNFDGSNFYFRKG